MPHTRRIALAAIYQYPILLCGALVAYQHFEDFQVEAFLAVAAISALTAMGSWAYCYRHILKKKGIQRADRTILRILIVLFNLPACLFYLHSNILYGEGQDEAQSLAGGAFHRKVTHLKTFCLSYLICLVILTLIFNNN